MLRLVDSKEFETGFAEKYECQICHGTGWAITDDDKPGFDRFRGCISDYWDDS